MTDGWVNVPATEPHWYEVGPDLEGDPRVVIEPTDEWDRFPGPPPPGIAFTVDTAREMSAALLSAADRIDARP